MGEKTLIIQDPVLKKGFTATPNAVLTAPGLSLGAKALYSILLMFAWQNEECWPGQERLAKACGCTDRTVRSYLGDLKKYGLISWVQRGLNQTNVYYIHDLATVERLKALNDADRKNFSGQDRKESSVQDRKNLSDKEDSINIVVVDRPQTGKINQRSPAGEDSPVPKRIAEEKHLPSRSEVQLPGKDVSPDDSEGQAGAQSLQLLAKEICGAEIPVQFFQSLLQEYSEAEIKEKLQLLSTARMEIKNIPGWLIMSLKNDYKHQPGSEKRGTEKRGSKINNHKSGHVKISAEEAVKKKDLIRSLYLN